MHSRQWIKKNLLNVKSQMSNEIGQSLIEVLVVATVGVLVVTALTFATIFSLRNAQFAKNSAQATKLAQEGIEWVRIGRDRNSSISISIGGVTAVDSWSGIYPIWGYQINGNCGDTGLPSPTYCYFNVSNEGQLQYLIAADSIPLNAESVGGYKRVVILSDDANWRTEKKVTVIVTWTDFSGPHESKLTTILRKL